MKKIVKIIVGILVVLVVLIVVVALVVGANLGAIVKTGMETVGPKVTQTTLTVDKVNISLLGGSAGVKGLVLGNPEGYKAPQSISVGDAAVSLVPGSLLSDKIVIRSVEVRAPEITFEGNPLGDNNLTKIMDNVNAMTGSGGQASTNAAAAPGQKPAKKLEVDDFVITGAKIHANLTGLVNKEVTLPLPDIHLTDLGKGTDGITAADLTKTVLSEITAGTVKALAGYVKDLGKDVSSGVLQNSTNAVNQGVNTLKKGIGNLLGK